MISKLILSGLLLPIFAAVISAADSHRTITVAGEGTATSPPDMATFSAAVVTEATTTAEALRTNNEAAGKIIDAVKEHQVADKDIQTSNLAIHPKYTRPRDGSAPKIVGYQVTNQVQVVVRNLPSLGTLLDAVVEAGSNQIQGIRFDIDNKEGLMNQARNRAVRDARARAELYAQASGGKVGKVLSIKETGTTLPQPRQLSFRAMAADAAVPIETGEQELRASVQITYEYVD